MSSRYKTLSTALLVSFLSLFVPSTATAHLMVAQHGTLNIVNNDVFMVLSLPLSAFEGLDTNLDGEVSMIEFNHQRAGIIQTIRQQISLMDQDGKRELQGLIMSPQLYDGHHGSEGLPQLTVMGKFTLQGIKGTLDFHLGLYGSSPEEQQMQITVTSGTKKQQVELTALSPKMSILL
ncbi:hypothetical protein [Shewanella sp. SR44-3]|uniref:hypothetical protein n=1 Tax=unclassified Shewanella TaxID=196818 RepID=UPI0015F9CDD1|nr:hypothetical protein [Shewanella sp. SR44-3]MBB1268861.1 hypothetical protein [Shewanella sp. SR44-3]